MQTTNGSLVFLDLHKKPMVSTRTRTLGYDGAGLLSVIEDEAL